MKFTVKDGLLFGVLCIAFGIYGMINRGGIMFTPEGWGDIGAIIVGLVVTGGSLILPRLDGRGEKNTAKGKTKK